VYYGTLSPVAITKLYAKWIERAASLPRPPFGTSIIERAMIFQAGRCYLCTCKFDMSEHKRPGRATRDHVTPRARGGRDDRNIMLACADCNVEKGDRLPTPDELAILAVFNEWAGKTVVDYALPFAPILERFQQQVREANKTVDDHQT
jgi:hypothetical protein